MQKEFFDLTLQGIINSLAILGGVVTTALLVLKYRREVKDKLDENAKKLEQQRREENEQRRKDENERARIESENEGKKDALLLEVSKELTARVRQAEQFAQAVIDSEHKMRAEMQTQIDAERKAKHDLANEYQAAIMRWHEEKSTMLITHQKEIAEVKLEYSRVTKTQSDCEQRIAELTKQLERLRETIEHKDDKP